MIQEREINLQSIFQVLYDRGRRIVINSFIAIVLAGVFTLFIHNRYESTATMYINISKIGVHMIGKSQFYFGTYWNMIPNKATLMQLIREYNLDEEPYNFKYAEDLDERIDIETFDEETQIYNISVVLEDATMAATIANRLADEVIDVAEKIRDFEIESSVDQLEDQLNPINERVDYFKDIYLNDLKTNLQPLLSQELDTNRSILATFRNELKNLEVSILETEQRLVGFEELFSSTDFTPVITVRRTLVNEPLLMERLREQQGALSPDALKSMTLYSEELNPQYLALEGEYKKAVIDLDAMKVRQDYTRKEIARLEKLVKDQQIQLFDMQTEELISKANFDRQLEVMSGVEKQVGWTGTTVTTERLDPMVIYQAVPNLKKVFPRRSIILALVGVTTFLISLMYYMFLDVYGIVKTRIQG